MAKEFNQHTEEGFSTFAQYNAAYMFGGIPDEILTRYDVNPLTGECKDILQERDAFDDDTAFEHHVNDYHQGREAGRVMRDGQRHVTFGKFIVPVAQLVYRARNEDWAGRPIGFNDGDKSNASIDNLFLRADFTEADMFYHLRNKKEWNPKDRDDCDALSANIASRYAYRDTDGQIIDKGIQQPVQGQFDEEGRAWVEVDAGDEDIMVPLSYVVVALHERKFPTDVFYKNCDLSDANWQNLAFIL